MSLAIWVPILISLFTFSFLLGGALIHIGQLIEKKQDKARCDHLRELCGTGNSNIFDLLFKKIDKIFSQLEEVKIDIARIKR